jgi:hypothetical protein
MHEAIETHAAEIHFFGGSAIDTPWQNAAFVFVAPLEAVTRLKQAVTGIREQYRQESVAWTEGETEFI